MYDINDLKALLLEAGKRAMKHFRNVTPSWKTNNTYVTAADIEVQVFLKTELERRFPDDGMIGEENGLSQEPRAGNRYWIIDPIDGTASFARGFPTWGIAVGLLTPDDALGGFFYMPTTGDLFYTTQDGGVWRNDEQVALPTPDMSSSEALLLAWPKWHTRYTVKPEFTGKIRSLGSTLAHLCYAATGSADAAFINRCPIWDLAAGLAMLFRNGGVLEYVDGTPVTLDALLRQRGASQDMFAGHPDAVASYRKLIT